ncbi:MULTISPECIES: VOC family protein [Chryseobacterium]|uniref:Lactoylglutathione lyase n=1 Tax=Chryseobacterium camelliae TaxID=1265445 RepID=A0ABU0THG5_9FLAO|nr:MULTISPECIES: VOC family protein [Chryseobacterium]MDT3406621.1 putative lactoylglutathione lyase [Pseudacidovorax intermedius]MDQ1095583.1 putative lactoylglutathione lyase [Chryseobacterium camelliae]MDQ1099519.1 putative lactoylglutathione lyase [Chryseobacterium sp. SORGH_AS_1048]MDR6086866.1 putative lactoylglutathione lyase [Chryseobacterium sp. SORGH_AS_0909]MDR6131238.1 putative lactoylglutathione lyase [Chryseobacterium sp. SORGH_AS_1175]
MEINQIYINLAVKNVQETKEFWTKLGFTADEQMSNEKGVCIVMKQGQISVMFLQEDYFRTFSEKPVPEAGTIQVLLALGLNSREEVDRMVATAVKNGSSQHEEPQDYNGMYQNSFWDINGYGWNIIYVDSPKLPE